MVLKTTFNNISVISWWSVLFYLEIEGPYWLLRTIMSCSLSNNRFPCLLRAELIIPFDHRQFRGMFLVWSFTKIVSCYDVNPTHDLI